MEAAVLLALVMSGVALYRATGAQRLAQRVEALESRARGLQIALEDLRAALRGAEEAGPATTADTEPRVEAAAPPSEPGPPAAPRPQAGSPPSSPQGPSFSPPPPPPRGPRLDTLAPNVDWEQLLGVRGAAILGGVVLALAGLYFFQYSIEHGLIPPWLRVVVGTLVGVGCIVGAEWRVRARYEATANALVGGGSAVLYAAFWAAPALYGLVPAAVGGALMVSVTGACTALAYRHRSLVIALIGLVGGFATPLLLSTGSNRPIELFAYILLLDAALLFVAQRRGWPLLALLSLAATVFYQVVWMGLRMRDDQVAIALAVLAIFAVAFALALRRVRSAEGRRQWLLAQGGGALLPFLLALFLADRADFGGHFAPVALLLAVLSASACGLARGLSRAWLGLGAAAGSTAVFAVWLVDRSIDGALAWETAGLCALLAAVFHVFVELDREKTGLASPAPAATLSALGLLALLALGAAGNRAPLWPWLAGQAFVAGLALRHGALPGRGPVQAGAAAIVALGLALFRWTHGGQAALPLGIDAPLCIALAVALQGLALWRGAAPWTERAAALFALLTLAGLALSGRFVDGAALPALGPTLALGLLAVLSATRLASGRWQLAALAVTAGAQALWVGYHRFPVAGGADGFAALALLLAMVALFAFWPIAARARLAGERLAWWAAILAPAAAFFPLTWLYEEHVGAASIGAVPVVLGGFSLATATLVRRKFPAADPLREGRLAWLLAAACGFAAVAIPLQLEKEWITLGWALEGVAVLALWRRFDHPGLKAFALALFAGVTLRLVANEAVLGYYPRPSWRIVNWLLYTYLVPAACLVAGARLLAPLEVARARPWARLYRGGKPVCSAALGAAAVAVVFVWLNLAIADWFASGTTLRVSFERLPARDLTTSLAWAVYAVALLAAGVALRSRGLRWVSLGLMLGTAAKVFLHDLGELEELYRVGSLLGLAVSLIVISLAYQRFVVREPASEESSRA